MLSLTRKAWLVACFLVMLFLCSRTETTDECICPSCSLRGKILAQDISAEYWKDNLIEAVGCACALFRKGQSAAHTGRKQRSLPPWMKLLLNENSHFHSLGLFDIEYTPDSYHVKLSSWEILGPLPIGKLELDADPVFPISFAHDQDVPLFLLGMPRNGSRAIISELTEFGKVSWKLIAAKKGWVDVSFASVDWNSLIQSMAKLEVYEFQGWARSTTFVYHSGQYSVHCPGVHSVYLRQRNYSYSLVGDVYGGGFVRSSAKLDAGPVGVVLPLRGAGRIGFTCSFELLAEDRTIDILQTSSIPHMLQIDSTGTGNGLLLSSAFCITLTNVHSESLSLSARVSRVNPLLPMSQGMGIRLLLNSSYFNIKSGQTLALPFEFFHTTLLPKDRGRIACETVVYVSIEPSKGDSQEVPIRLSCRRQIQSFLISFLDHDGSVSQAAVVLPRNRSAPSPVLLSLHGTGISPLNQADAYKHKPFGEDDFTFGVEEYWILAPTRHGAHNWEGIGASTALHSLEVLRKMASLFPSILPQVSLHGGIIAGHSMGAHGAWLVAVNSPGKFSCLAPAAGWIRKEEYNVANSFFAVDVSNSFVAPKLKMVLEQAMTEYHVDRLVENLNRIKTHIRVGQNDKTTHPWFSRRMHRLLNHFELASTLEELPGKEHWWWDTANENDGGVLNDEVMRRFYHDCASVLDMKRNNCLNGYNRSKPFKLLVINLASQEGICGVRIMQQFSSMRLSRISGHCSNTSWCSIISNGNVQRLKISRESELLAETAGVVTFNVDDTPLTTNATQSDIYICWNKQSIPFICNIFYAASSLQPSITGPVRMVYSKPLLIVYGTGSTDSEILREVYQTAVYLANQNAAAHSTFISLHTDEEYFLISKQTRKNSNVIFIGGLTINKAMRWNARILHEETNITSAVKFEVGEGFTVTGSGNVVSDQDSSLAIVFTLPTRDHSVAVCIHAASFMGYRHLSRLLWPTVPPMVRAPLSVYLPDFIVINVHSVWSKGLGAVLLAGYWQSNWSINIDESFVGY